MAPLIQDVIVGLIALAAGVFVIRRVIDTVRPAPSDAGCDHCGVAGEGDGVPRPPKTQSSA